MTQITITRTAQELTEYRNKLIGRIGFVPTMGNLHQGHISLLQEALGDCDTAFFSIFVNPKQFGPNEDFDKYPRTFENDLKLLKALMDRYPEKKMLVFAPQSNEEVFPATEKQIISVFGFNRILEGKFRPDHFDGVTTVVFRLFQLVRPHKSYFGLKDYQQWFIIKKMTQDLQLPIEIIGMPIIRETSGLAMSSRNQYLSEQEKEEALVLYRSLKGIQEIINGQRANLLAGQAKIKELLKDPRWNYLELRNASDLSEDLSKSNQLTLLGVYQLGKTRLLDNLQMEIR